MTVFRVLVRFLVGIFFGIGVAVALSPFWATFAGETGQGVSVALLAIVLCSALICAWAPGFRRSFGRGFLLNGMAVFVLPISTFFLSGRVISEAAAVADDGTEASAVIGAGLAGIAATGLAAFFGVFIGVVLLLIGTVLCLGGRREVVVVDRARRAEPEMSRSL